MSTDTTAIAVAKAARHAARSPLRANTARYLRALGPKARMEFYRTYGCGPYFNPATAGGDATPDRPRPQGWATR